MTNNTPDIKNVKELEELEELKDNKDVLKIKTELTEHDVLLIDICDHEELMALTVTDGTHMHTEISNNKSITKNSKKT